MSVSRRIREGVSLAALTFFFLGLLATSAWALPDFDGDGSPPPQDCDNTDPAVAPGKPDLPDLDFEDTNCDGIDGTISDAVFVSRSTGDDAFSGSKDFPKRTIGAALTVAKADDKDIYVTAGPYDEVITLLDDADGVGIYGGYVPVTFQRSTAEATAITGNREAVIANDAQGIVLQLLTLNGVAPGGSGQSAYGLRAIEGSSVALRGVTASGGDGRAAFNGTSFFRPNTPARPAPAICGIGDPSRGAPGIGGNSGGIGGAGGFGAGSGSFGTGGNGPFAGGAGPIGGSNQSGDNGGTAFQPGATGGNGGNATFGVTNAGIVWDDLDNSTNGVSGSDGSGGGGGGGSGGSRVTIIGTTINGPGGGGGGGGAGGFGGTRGTRATGGGGSFGAYLFNSTLVASESELTSGNGGNGGNGGEGAPGGLGGLGGLGAIVCGLLNNLSGGNGGNGSRGGGGGDGGGGGGGPSFGVFRTGAGAVYTSRSSDEVAGTAGTGGTRGTGGSRAAAGEASPLKSAPSATGTTADFDGDGETDAADACPETAAGTANGCPNRPAKLADGDRDEIPDANDACAGTPRGGTDLDENGCPDTPPPPPPPPAPAGRDADGDGFFAGQDCDDNNGNIRPGAQELVGNTTDENCDGIATPFPNITSAVGNNWAVVGRRVRLTELRARNVPQGARGQIRCKGKKCKFKRKNVRARKGSIDFLKALKKKQRRFRAGQTIEVRVTAPNMIGKVVRFKLKRGKIPKGRTLCLDVGASRPEKCA